MEKLRFIALTSVPDEWEKRAFYAIYLGGDTVDCYITSSNGIPKQVGNAAMITAIFNDLIGTGGIVTVVDNNTNPDRHLISTVDGKQIYETVVSLQNFNLSNNILSLTLNNEDGDEQTVSVDLTELDTNLGYTPSPTDGIVTNTAGDNATIPLADETNAGLLSPQEKERIDSAIQPGDNISELTNDIGFITVQDIPSTTLDNDVFSDVDTGAITAGETIAQGTTFTEFVEQLLTKIFYPTFTPYSISGSAGSAVEVGTGTKTITVNFTRGNIVGDVDSGVWNPTLVQGQVLGAANKYWINGTDNGASNSASVSEITTLGSNSVPIAVDYDAGAQPKDSKGNDYLTPEPSGTLNGTATWTGFYYRTAIAGNDAPNASDVRTSYTARRSNAGVINMPTGTTSVRFDVFVPQGSTLTSAIDEGNLNLDITSEFVLQSPDFSGLDANGDEVLYKHYVRIVDNPYTVSSNIAITVT